MKVKFVQGFRGRETQERFYQAGDVADIDPLDLVERGIVKIIVLEPVKVKIEPAVKPAAKKIIKRATVSPTKKGKK